jgi:hypothetical protein
MPDLRRLGVCTVTVLLQTAVAGSLLIPGMLYAGDSPAAPQRVNASAFAKLRSDYSSQPLYDAFYVGDERRQSLVEAIKAKDAEQVVAIGQPWLERCPVDAEAHFHVAMALNALGRHREAFSHLYWFHGLIQSILETGAGTSKGSAFKVISVSEEYDVLRVLRAELVNQTLDPPYDVMTVKIDSEEMTLYFDVSISLGAQRRQLEGAVKGESK